MSHKTIDDGKLRHGPEFVEKLPVCALSCVCRQVVSAVFTHWPHYGEMT